MNDFIPENNGMPGLNNFINVCKFTITIYRHNFLNGMTDLNIVHKIIDILTSSI